MVRTPSLFAKTRNCILKYELLNYHSYFSSKFRVTWQPYIYKFLLDDKIGIKTNLSSSPQDSVSNPDSLDQDPDPKRCFKNVDYKGCLAKKRNYANISKLTQLKNGKKIYPQGFTAELLTWEKPSVKLLLPFARCSVMSEVSELSCSSHQGVWVIFTPWLFASPVM